MNARLVVRLLKPKAPKPGAWSMLAAPIDPTETMLRMRAQSLMSPTPRGGACPPLTMAQALDVLAWANTPAPFPARSPAEAHSPCVPAAGFSVSDDEE